MGYGNLCSVRIFIPLYTGQVIGNIVHGRGYAPLIQSTIIMGVLTCIR